MIYECNKKLLRLCGADDDDNILGTPIMQLCPNGCIKLCLTFIAEKCEEQLLKVEEELLLLSQKRRDSSVSRFLGPKYVLQKIVLSFMEKLYIYPLDSKFPECRGIYFIYHVGETQLYEGSQVVPCISHPIYVGLNVTDEHC